MSNLNPPAEPTPAEFAAAWVHGWTRTRNTASAQETPDGWQVEVGLPGHQRRFILPAFDAARLAQLGHELHQPETWLKIMAAPAEAAVALGAGWAIQAPEYLMSTHWADTAVTVPPGYQLHAWAEGAMFKLELRTEAGQLAASARSAIWGNCATIDQVVTEPEHRRRGLGRVLMAALARQAVESGAPLGVLVATEEGRALYQALGWQLVSPVTAAVAKA